MRLGKIEGLRAFALRNAMEDMCMDGLLENQRSGPSLLLSTVFIVRNQIRMKACRFVVGWEERKTIESIFADSYLLPS